MLLFTKKKVEAKDAAAEQTPFYEFVPYHSHVDPQTLITKNGELMQIIRIVSNTRGLDYESGEGGATVRDAVRQAIVDCIKTDKVALWVHTLRNRRPVSYQAKFSEEFPNYVHEQWQEKHHWKYQYHNEIYITLLYDGQECDLLNKNTFKHVFLPKLNRQYRNAYLQKAHEELKRTSAAMVERIRPYYNAQLLSLVERVPQNGNAGQAVFYSEPMEFLGTLVNLHNEPRPLTHTDMSMQLTDHAVSFGFNAIESKSPAGHRRFGAMLTLKQYREVPQDTVDRVLQAPMEFIISQSFNFIPGEAALKQYKEQKEMFDVSGDFDSIRTSGIEDMLMSDQKRPIDFGEQQMSIMVLTDDYKQLDSEVIRVQSAFSELGLITIREDIKLEECYWSQLPGNFPFLRRKDPINTPRAAGFVRMNRFPGGSDAGNHWGEAVTLLPTSVGSPYFFNFHHQDNGHTVMFDFNSFNDHAGRVLANFLLAETRKYNGRLYVFDHNRGSHLFFDKLGGVYHDFPSPRDGRGARRLALNPFALEDSPRNRAFLLAWCQTLLPFPVDEQQKGMLQMSLDQMYSLPAEQRNLENFIASLNQLNPTLATSYADWIGRGRFAPIFGTGADGFDTAQAMQGFNMAPLLAQPETVIPAFSYLMHRLINSIDGRPTILVLHEAWNLLENAFFAPRLESLLEMLKQHNVMVLFTCSRPADCINTHIFQTVMNSCATHLYLPDDINLPYAAYPVGLSESDQNMLLHMDRQKGDFLVRQGGESISLRAYVKEMDDVYAIFSNDIKNLIAAGGRFASLPKDE